MAEFSLPANSKIGAGKTWPAPPSPKRPRNFRVYRWSPDDGKNPAVDTYPLDPALAAGREHGAPRQGVAAIDRGAREARRAVGMHPVLLLHDLLPVLLVEWRPLPRPGGAVASLSLDRRQPRREDRQPARCARRPVPALPLPHDPELHQDLPKKPQPGQSHRRDQEAPGAAPLSAGGQPCSASSTAVTNNSPQNASPKRRPGRRHGAATPA